MCERLRSDKRWEPARTDESSRRKARKGPHRSPGVSGAREGLQWERTARCVCNRMGPQHRMAPG